MELHIQNVKATKDRNFFFEPKFYLLKGPSGSNKSSCLESIKFALFGGGTHLRPRPHSNKKKTSVTLKYQDLTITRSKNPEQLVLLKENKLKYLNQEAQYIIDQKFHTENIWYLSSYIPQKRRNIFLESSGSEKLEILKELIFKENKDTNQQTFDIIDELTRNLLDKIKNIDGTIEYIIKDLLRIKEENSDYLLLYEEGKNIEDIDLKIENIRNELEIYDKYIELKEMNINPEDIKKELKTKYPSNINLKLLERWKKYLNWKDDIQNVNEKECEKYCMEDLLEERNKILTNKKIEVRFKTNKIKELIKKIKSKLDYMSFEKKIKIIKKLEIYIKELEGTQEGLDRRWKSLLINIGYEIVVFDKFLAHKIKENYLTKEIKNFRCPECSTKLFFENNKLQKNKININSKDKDNYLDLIESYNTLLTYKIESENKIKILKKDIPNNIEDVEVNIHDDDLEESLRILYIYDYKVRKLEEVEQEIDNYNIYRKYLDLKDFIDYKYEVPDDFDEYYKRYLYINNIYNEIKDLDLNIDVEKAILDKDELEKLEKYKQAISRCSIIDIREKDLKIEEKNRKKYMESLENINLLNNIIRETENKFMEMRIGEINQQLNEFLDLLFEDINIQISMFREIKGKDKNKPQVNLVIYFEGIEYPNFGYFSDGEKDRISLALTITFNIILGSPLLMFDEVFSSLEENKREDCLKLIRKFTNNKILLNICHETIEGFYDEIIKF